MTKYAAVDLRVKEKYCINIVSEDIWD